MTFADYVQHCRLRIQQRPEYAKANKALRQHILEANMPFEWSPPQPTRKAVLLMHGLFDSPSSLHSLGQFFVKEGYLVRGLLLPGHGTKPEDLLQISHTDWLNACQSALAQLPTSIEQRVLCGFSTGGLLSHYLSLKQAIPQLSAIISFAPALALRAPSWLLSNRLLSQALQRVMPWHYKTTRYDYARYNQHAFRAGCEVQRLIDLSQDLPTDTYQHLPAFYVLAAEDEVVDSQAVQRFFQQHCSHPQSRCLTYGSETASNDARLLFRPSRWPTQHIESFSHICLPIAPHHPHYGREGDYTRESYQLLKPGQAAILGKKGGRHTIRLSYNPDFEYVCERLRGFLNSVL